ncbi:lipase [Phlyctema vagabunda]|uniref:Lipase n=1 Tax=Phlyctema vagabunda TaxID=108571 RepID=A0ABR4PIJ2_9HELO
MKRFGVLSILVYSAVASPVAVALDKHIESRNVTVSPAEIVRLRLFANFTAASYCPNNQDPASVPGQLITCNGTICASVEETEATSLLQFGGDDLTSTAGLKGFLALSAPQKSIILAFAGSGQTIRTWLTNFNFVQTPYTLENSSTTTTECVGCTVHTGFQTAWHERRTGILSALSATVAAQPEYKVVVTGHSIGGAVATLAALEIAALLGPSSVLELYTYGSPRVGNAAFADFATTVLAGTGSEAATGLDISNYRVTHRNDPVPQIPPTWVGYQHLAPEYWIPNDDPTTNTVDVCEAVEDPACNAGTGLIPLEGASHSLYFGTIDACVGGVEW